MANDREVLKEIWDGKVPACFRLSLDEVTSAEQPSSVYLLVPRQSYFPFCCDKVLRHFSSFTASPPGGDMWLDYEGVPLKWHYPVGLLFDLLTEENPQLPWTLTVHFQNFPSDQLLRCSGRDAADAHFMSRLKEADALKHRGDVISVMQKRDHTQLLLGLRNDRFEQFWEVNRRLMEHSKDELFKYIPFTIHQPDLPVVQKLLRPLGEDGQLRTLGDLLSTALPAVTDWSCYRVLLQGISPPLDAPAQWLSEHLSYPDNFLHIALLPR